LSEFAEDTQKKKPQPTPEWASAEALGSNYRLQIKVENRPLFRQSEAFRAGQENIQGCPFASLTRQKILDFQPLS
jgi:hypothetical protein